MKTLGLHSEVQSRDGKTEIFPKSHITAFTDCIITFANNIERKVSVNEELKEVFFTLAHSNTKLPEGITCNVIDDFIKILVTLVAINYGYSIAVESLNILFSYLKNDDRVFHRFNPSKELLARINLEKYIASDIKEERILAINFACFLLRYYEDIDYNTITNSALVFDIIRKAEIRRAWMDIESLAVTQENIMSITKQNQEITSKAIAELFVYIEEIKKNNEYSIKELSKSTLELKEKLMKKGLFINSQGKYLQADDQVAEVALVKSIENNFNKKLEEMQKSVDKLLNETDGLEIKSNALTNKCEVLTDVIEDTERKVQEAINMITTESLLIKDTNNVFLTRISKVENDVLALTQDSSIERKDITSLRVDSLRSQIDVEIMPKINEMQMKLKAKDITLSIAEGKKESASTNLLTKLNEKGINTIATLVKAGVDAVGSEIENCKRQLNAMKTLTMKLQEMQETIKKELKKEFTSEIEAQNIKRNELQKDLNIKHTQLANIVKTYNEDNSKCFSNINERLSKFLIEFGNYSKEINETLKGHTQIIGGNYDKTEERLKVLKSDCSSLNNKIAYLEKETPKLARAEEVNMKLTKFEERLMRLSNIESRMANNEQLNENTRQLEKLEQRTFRLESFDERISNIERLEDKLIPIADKVSKIDSTLTSIKSKELSLQERIHVLENQPPQINSDSLLLLKEEYDKRIEQLKVQVQEYFDTVWNHIQQFTDQHGKDKIKEIKNQETSYTSKLNCLEWLLRYHHYISGESTVAILETFREYIHPSKVYERTAYSSVRHASDIMSQLYKSIRELKNSKDDCLSDAGIYLSILEISLVNDQNTDTGISLGLIQELFEYLVFLQSSYDFKECIVELKMVIRCLTYCFRNIKAIDALLERSPSIELIISLIESISDEEVLANLIKIIRVSLRSDRHYERLLNKMPNIFNVLTKFLSFDSCNEVVLEEVTAALKNLTRRTQGLHMITDPSALSQVYKLASDKGLNRCKEYSMNILINCSKSERLLPFIKQIGIFENSPKAQ